MLKDSFVNQSDTNMLVAKFFNASKMIMFLTFFRVTWNKCTGFLAKVAFLVQRKIIEFDQFSYINICRLTFCKTKAFLVKRKLFFSTGVDEFVNSLKIFGNTSKHFSFSVFTKATD